VDAGNADAVASVDAYASNDNACSRNNAGEAGDSNRKGTRYEFQLERSRRRSNR